jgi:uncharacterized protein involved in outer membrane biogenesis
MKKWILIGFSALVVIIVIVVVAGLSNLGPIIKNVVNTYGPRMTKTEMRLGDVAISIFSGQAKLKDFYLGNPKGFKSFYAMKVGSMYVDVDEGSLTSDTIIINKIEVVRPEITYEKMGGTDNFKTILNNVKSSTGRDKPSKKQSDKENGGKKILIRDFIIREGKVNLFIPQLIGKSIGVSLPDIHLKDVGNVKGGASASEAFGEVFAELYKTITSPAVIDTLNQGVKTLGMGIETVGKDAKKGLETATSKVKGLFGK